jgi:glycosyltransferase involved in cell wall biosynthesis
VKSLHIQHARGLGGSAMSLLYTVQGLRARGYECVVALGKPTPEMHALYADAGFETIDWPGIESFEHTTLEWASPFKPKSVRKFLAARLDAGTTRRRTLELVASIRPDVVHLNSVVLYDSAAALLSTGRAFVWHVREPPVDGVVGLRKGLLSRALRSPGCETIFICEADRDAWVGRSTGTVVRNFVDLARFSPDVDGRAARASLGVPDGVPLLLYVGGPHEVKGWRPLLAALAILKSEGVGFVCAMPGTVIPSLPAQRLRQKIARAVLPRVGIRSEALRFEGEIGRLKLERHVRCLPFEPRIDRLLAACDVLTFPAVRPHFARPVVEAAAMGRPSVASDLPGTTELIVDRETGILVPHRDPRRLATALAELIGDAELRRAMGAAGRRLAEREYDAVKQVDKIAAVFARVAQRAR